MNKRKSASIIGAGVGGITTAIFLAQKGYEVNVYEKNLFAGGRCGQILREGHRFDIGATILLMPNLYRHVFNAIGFNFDEYMEVIPVDTLYKLFFDDGSMLDINTDLKSMKPKMEEIEKGSYKKLLDYISKGYHLYELSFQELLGRNFIKSRDFINFKNIWLLVRLKAFIKHNQYIRRFFKHPHLKMAFTFQNIYIGQSPYDAPALFSMLPAIELTEGSLFLKGGMYSVVDKLMKYATGLGVNFIFNKSVKKIIIHRKKVTGLLLDDNCTIETPLVIANADLPYVFRELLPDHDKSLKLEKKNYSCSAFVFHWGIDRHIDRLGLHNVFLSDRYHENLSRIFKNKSMSDNPDFYIYAPTRCDRTAAPEGQDSLTAIVPVGHIDKHYTQDWKQFELKARSYVFRRLKELGIGDIAGHIKFEICLHPGSWEDQCNVMKGGVFGSLSHNIMQMGYFRPHNRHDSYNNLYFVGGSTHPGSGIPLVLMSAKLVSERILNEN